MSVRFEQLRTELDRLEPESWFSSSSEKAERSKKVNKIADKAIAISCESGRPTQAALECYRALREKSPGAIIDLNQIDEQVKVHEQACPTIEERVNDCLNNNSLSLYEQGASAPSRAAEFWNERDRLLGSVKRELEILKEMQTPLLRAQYLAPKESLASVEAFSTRRKEVADIFNRTADLQERFIAAAEALDPEKLLEETIKPRLEEEAILLENAHSKEFKNLKKRCGVIQAAALLASVALGAAGVLEGTRGSAAKAALWICVGMITAASRWLV